MTRSARRAPAGWAGVDGVGGVVLVLGGRVGRLWAALPVGGRVRSASRRPPGRWAGRTAWASVTIGAGGGRDGGAVLARRSAARERRPRGAAARAGVGWSGRRSRRCC